MQVCIEFALRFSDVQFQPILRIEAYSNNYVACLFIHASITCGKSQVSILLYNPYRL